MADTTSVVCPTCQRTFPAGTRVEGVGCFDCFHQWYDGDLPHPDNLSREKVGNHVRKKHGLPPLEPRGRQ
jgi:protein-arginine kinase activator protein McsA